MSEDLPTPPAKKTGCCLGSILILGALGFLLMIAATVGPWVWRARSAARVDEELARIRAAGEPASAAELHDFYVVPPEDTDCTSLWLEAIAPFDSQSYTKACESLPIVGDAPKIPPPGEPWPEQAAVEAFLEQYADSMKLMHQAAQQHGTARYDIDFEAGFDTKLDHVDRLRSAARMLMLEAHLRAHRGDADGAAESIGAILRVSESLRDEPLLVSQLVRYACATMGLNLAGEMLPHVDFRPEDLATLQDEVEAMRLEDGFRRAMIGERASGIEVFRNPAAQTDMEFDVPTGPRNDDLTLYLQFMDEIIDAARKPWPERLKATSRVDQRIQARIENGGPLDNLRYVFTFLLLPASNAVVEADGRTQALVRAATVRIALQRYRLEHGQFPESIEQLVPKFLDKVPEDPFDGQPLRYAIRDGEPLVYSVGRDQVDNGGDGDDRGQPDILFPLPDDDGDE